MRSPTDGQMPRLKAPNMSVQQSAFAEAPAARARACLRLRSLMEATVTVTMIRTGSAFWAARAWVFGSDSDQSLLSISELILVPVPLWADVVMERLISSRAQTSYQKAEGSRFLAGLPSSRSFSRLFLTLKPTLMRGSCHSKFY
jgi:hypothetical protein